MIIKADTPQELQREIVKWLEDQAIQYSIGARMATRKRVAAAALVKSETVRAIAEYVGKMQIDPKKPIVGFVGNKPVYETIEYPPSPIQEC